MLFNYKPNLNAKDLLKRPPLYFAVENKNTELVKELLLRRANPWSSGLKQDYVDLCDKDIRIVYFIQKFRNVGLFFTGLTFLDRDAWQHERHQTER